MWSAAPGLPLGLASPAVSCCSSFAVPSRGASTRSFGWRRALLIQPQPTGTRVLLLAIVGPAERPRTRACGLSGMEPPGHTGTDSPQAWPAVPRAPPACVPPAAPAGLLLHILAGARVLGVDAAGVPQGGRRACGLESRFPAGGAGLVCLLAARRSSPEKRLFGSFLF